MTTQTKKETLAEPNMNPQDIYVVLTTVEKILLQ